MRRVYITFSHDPEEMVYGPFWCMEDEDGDVQTSLIEDMIDDITPADPAEGLGLPNIWFDNPPRVNPPNDDPASRWEGF